MIYEYKCEKCNKIIQLSQKSSVTICDCGAKALRYYSALPVHYKGPGFYTVDSRRFDT